MSTPRETPMETAEAAHGPEEPALADWHHPKGTLAVVLLYALLFILGWAGLYFWVFVPRGTPHP